MDFIERTAPKRCLKDTGNIFIRIQKGFAYKIIQPIISLLVIGAVIAGSGAGISFASQMSVPGDIFYPIKLTIEKAQVSLQPSEEEKVKLEVEFAGRRLEELNKVRAQKIVKGGQRAEKTKIALDNFKKNIATVHERLDKMKDQKFTEKTVAMVKLVEEKTLEYSKTLQEEKKQMEAAGEQKNDMSFTENADDVTDAKQGIKEAATISEEVSDKIVDIILEKQEKGEINVEPAEIAAKVKNKLDNIEQKIDALKEKTVSVGNENQQGGEIVNVDNNDLNEKATTTISAITSTSTPISISTSTEILVIGENNATSTRALLNNDINKINESMVEAKALLENGEVSTAFGKAKEINRITLEMEKKIDVAATLMQESQINKESEEGKNAMEKGKDEAIEAIDSKENATATME